MKKAFLATAIAGIFFSGCVNTSMIGNTTTYPFPYKNTQNNKYHYPSYNQQYQFAQQQLTMAAFTENPIINLEIDLVMAEEFATLVKMNSLLLDRMAISLDDKWPELLQDFSKTKNSEKFKTKEYLAFLSKQLENDYSFYKLYSPSKIIDLIKKTGGIALIASPSAIKKITMLGIVGKYGENLEHLKAVISRTPLGCYNVMYYNPKYQDIYKKVDNKICKRIDKLIAKKCEFFSKPIEDAIDKYGSDFYTIKIGKECLKTVEGKTYPSFKAAFYELLPFDYKDKIKNIEDELFSLSQEQASKKSELALLKVKKEKEKINVDDKIALLNKQIDEINKKIDEKKDIRSKYYDNAIKKISITPQKYKIAKKLKLISNYINNSLNGVGIGTVILGVNVFFDVKDLLTLASNPQQALMYTSMIYIESGAITDRKKALDLTKKRLKFLLKRTVMLPKNAAEVVAGIVTQKMIMSDYEDYIDAIIEAGKKAGYKI
jgi:hypothetical protein